MIKALVFDFSRVLLFPKDATYLGSLNDKHKLLTGDVDYKFFDYFRLNEELLDFLKSWKNKFNLFLFTSETIQDTKELQPYLSPIFDKVFSAIKLGVGKKDPTSYELITKELKLPASEILFIDDSLENIEAAKQAGLQTIQYKNNDELISQISTLIP